METDTYHVNLRKCAQPVCYPGMHEWTRDDGANRETTGEGPGLRKNNLVRRIGHVGDKQLAESRKSGRRMDKKSNR